MSATNYNQTFSIANTLIGTVDVAIPATAFNISLTVAGARGGTAGGDSGGPGGGGGTGKVGVFTLPNYTARTLTLRPGAIGIDGPGCFGRGTAPTGGVIRGGGGGSASGCSGSGGSGGGASGVVDSLSGFYIVIAGGGGGGGGGAWEVPGEGARPALNGGDWIVNTGQFSGVAASGNNGSSAACGDGSGGGGGGGGAGSAAEGGSGGCDFSASATGGRAGLSTYYVPSGISLVSTSTNSGAGYITLSYTSVIPQINSFTANPVDQYSSGGTPLYSTILQWSVVDANSLTITSSAGETFNVTGTSSLNITNLPQSNAAGSSPVTRSYTLTACYNSVCTSSTINVNAKNDNSPSNSWTQTFSNLEPNTEYQFFIGKLSGVDMPTSISTSGSGNFIGKTFGGSFAQSLLFNAEENVILKFTSLPFNTDISGETGIYGKTNVKTISVTAGTQSFNVTATTRAPRIAEDFDYANNTLEYPFQDIDLIANAPNQYATSNSITVDNIELLSTDNATEIKSNDGNLQVNINNTGWKNVRQI